MLPVIRPTIKAADYRNGNVNTTDMMGFAAVNQKLGPLLATPEGFIDLCLAAQDNRDYFRRMWGKPHFVLNLEYRTNIYEFNVDGTVVLVWTSKRGSSIEVITGNAVERNIEAALTVREEIIRQLRRWLPVNDPNKWKLITSATEQKA